MNTQVFRLCLAGALLLCAPASFAYPVITSERISSQHLSSQYRDGYQVGGAGTAFTHYFQQLPNGTWSAAQELRLDLATLQPLLAAGKVKLTGYNNATQSWEEYAGNGNNLTAHTTNYGWNYRYTRSFDGSNVEIDVQMAFDWSLTNLTDPQKRAQKLAWEANIEGWWNNQFSILKDDIFLFGIVFDVTFDGYDNGRGGREFDQTITVKPGNGRADMTTWYLNDGAQTNSHEFGHMLGLFDEYWAGALNTATLLTDYTHLMGAGAGSLAFGGGMKKEYYLPFMNWLDAIDPDPTQRYALVPEPGTVFLLVAGLLWLAFPRAVRHHSVSRSAVAEILWMERSAPLNSSSASRRRPVSFFSVP
jgi:hypothetical protein